jgi:hypothetical protein
MQITGLLVLCGGNKKAPAAWSDRGWLIMMHFAAAMRLRKSLIAAAFIAHIRSAMGADRSRYWKPRGGGLLVAGPPRSNWPRSGMRVELGLVCDRDAGFDCAHRAARSGVGTPMTICWTHRRSATSFIPTRPIKRLKALPFNAPKCDAKGQQMARKGDVTAAMTFIQGGKVDHGRPRPWSLAPPELTLIMRNSAWVALICVSGTDGHRSPQQLRRHQKNSPGQDGGAGAR